MTEDAPRKAREHRHQDIPPPTNRVRDSGERTRDNRAVRKGAAR